ncbi:serine/threonine-protein kinase [Nocardiopsis suaedae]|uniref:Serine/threonine-protein kinase n=1 Tax=Nocardiopsis suaedae TaxID=3018444 RepID=A0ABT4TJA6_9ACTN|nr:serine/threonine-protein kinase [Nocardiopsis suaedae]MDA2804750.1 serine/threonine-protein kinase [Nocardiopsis suaedae]
MSSLAAEGSRILPLPLWLITVVAVVVVAIVTTAVLLWRNRGAERRSAAVAAGPNGGPEAVAADAAPTARNGPGDPSHIGPYRVHGRLGGGGMGRVFLAHSPGGRTVAVKVVHPGLADDPEFRRRFATEVEAARRVGGFFTAQVVDADPDGTPPWLATAYIPGPSLQEVVQGHGPLPAAPVAALGAGLAEGLKAVHGCRLVHRDLKPGNVVLSPDGPRVIDFGIARALDSTSATRTSTVLGTAAFMSPEQVTGQEVGPASDVFSLGCVLAFAASGRSPFGEGPAYAVTHRVVYSEPDLAGLAGPLKELVDACLAKDPAERPALDRVLAVCRPLFSSDPGRPDGTGSSEALTEVLSRHATRVEPPGTPP